MKIRKQIGLLANLSWEWPAREGKGRRTEEKKCLDKEEEETTVISEKNEKMDEGKYWHSRKKRRCMFT